LYALLFADDTTLFASADTLAELINFVNAEFKKVVSYFRANKMSLHPDKTKFILFNYSGQEAEVDINIYIDNNNENEFLLPQIPLERIEKSSKTPAIKFLGIYIDPALNFQFHIKHICSKLSNSMFALRSVKNILPVTSLKTLYYSLIHCYLIYGIHIWSAASASNLNLLAVKQKSAIRIISEQRYNSHTEPLFKKLKILSLNELITFFKLVFMFDFAHGNLPLSFKNMWRTNFDLRNSENPMALRNDHDYYIPFIRLDSFVKFPLSEYPRLWNEFESNEIKSIDSRNLFKKLLKEHFFDKLADSITCDRLLCPSCHLNQ
jgi:hypothetical protein